MRFKVTPWGIGLGFFLLAITIRFSWMVHSGDWKQPLQHWMMEEVAIAQHIAAGRGFLCPYVEYDTGKPPVYSALSAPAYPYMLAGLIQMFGKELTAYRASMVINGLIGSMAVGLLAGLAFARFGRIAGFLAGLLGSLLPPMVYRSATLWDTPFVMLFVVIILVVAGSLRPFKSLLSSACLGAGFGLAALFNPIVLPLIFAGIIVLAFREPTVLSGVRRMMTLSVACVLVLLPWTIRNYQLFGSLVPIRNCMGRELWIGQQPSCDGTSQSVGMVLLSESKPESEQLQELGEGEYFRWKMNAAINGIRNDFPGFVSKTLRRVSLFWIGDLSKSPFGDLKGGFLAGCKAAALLSLLFLALIGIRSDPDKYMQWFGLFALLVLPMPYYVTHVCPQYRIPVLLLEIYWAGAGVQYLVQFMTQVARRDANEIIGIDAGV